MAVGTATALRNVQHHDTALQVYGNVLAPVHADLLHAALLLHLQCLQCRESCMPR